MMVYIFEESVEKCEYCSNCKEYLAQVIIVYLKYLYGYESENGSKHLPTLGCPVIRKCKILRINVT